MRKHRVEYGEPIGWTLENIQQVLFDLSLGGAPGDTMVLLDSCGCCSNLDEGGISLSNSISKPDEKVIIIRRQAGFEDEEES